MEQWSLSQYVRPILKTEFLQKKASGIIDIGEYEAELEINSDQPDTMLRLLQGLRIGDLASWEKAKNEYYEDSEIGQVIATLNEFGFIRETAPKHTLDKKRIIINDVLDESFDALKPWHSCLINQASSLQEFIINLKNENFSEVIKKEKNAFVLYSKIALITWQELCPPGITAALNLLHRITGHPEEKNTIDCTAFWAGEVRKCLSVITWTLVRSLDSDAERKSISILPIEHTDSGTNLALRLERWAIETLNSFGTGRFPAALKTNQHAAQKTLIQAVYAQEYYITERFIDLVSASMALRLPRSLKKLLRRYYSEETGHESYELRTCISLGLKEDDLHEALPPPFAQLVCDIYTWLAGHHIVAYAAAATLTEGLPGQPNIINAAVAASEVLTPDVNESSRKHELLNEKLYHPYISRLLLAECGEQSVETQCIARDSYGLLLEMTWRTWEELEKMHIQMKRPALNFSIKDFLHL
ncbi:hypothetical protein [Xenorhabdus bovienii]|uniref:Thiaminase-2/PQQC domain-containing protein n=1 Tax=Xenorhabdus bovienii str. feltiae Moldova TaxID=1398200 RepID=A0A077NSU7_XENBV|nr:hypothetical protein [Xenorhabdus bovienii]CDH01568.1 conserved hypothetical protein [Xenorhabdus bovienii str. feltiae Moldova]